MTVRFNVSAAREFLAGAARMRDGGAKEDALIAYLLSNSTRLFPNNPWWIQDHVTGTEAVASYEKDGKTRRGFVDALVGTTVIEYEKDLRMKPAFETGYEQIRTYCASELNKGVPQDLLIGVLSDTVCWYAYRVKEVLKLPDGAQKLGPEQVILEQIEAVDLSEAGDVQVKLFFEFISRYLGREASRPLRSDTLVKDLGFESEFCRMHLESLREIVNDAFASNPQYSKLIMTLWSNFISYLGDSGNNRGFDRETYVSELYILTLAKLICANVLEGKALVSDDQSLCEILDGTFFKARKLTNLVEYDYFGWLNQPPYVENLIPVARAIQDDLRVYNFDTRTLVAEDLFGPLMAQLARKTKRLLLGQEWTPAWLASAVVERVMDQIPPKVEPRLVDMCCGTGAMVIEVVKRCAERLMASGVEVGSEGVLSRLSEAITGFDIDPLAVMLAKTGWVLAARDWLSGATEVFIPIYHADSLFTATPVTKRIDEAGSTHQELILDDKKVALPNFLVSPEHNVLFDTLLQRSYNTAMYSASQPKVTFGEEDVSNLVRLALRDSGDNLQDHEVEQAESFCKELLYTLDALQRTGRNGIWAFILSNSYRPGLVAGQFNGLVSNPPWLAMSKVADNPYRAALRDRAESYAVKPPGSSHLHIELATIFLLHAIDRYLIDGAVFGCILPESILSAHHHNPFRKGDYKTAARNVNISIEEIWRVENGTFKNEAIVLFGSKSIATPKKYIPGKKITPERREKLIFKSISWGKRTAWSDNPPAKDTYGVFDPAKFYQGADVFPRTVVFHEMKRIADGNWDISPAGPKSQIRYTRAQAKNLKDFSMTISGFSDDFVFDVLLSNHLTPFHITDGAKGILPIQRVDGRWKYVSETTLAMYSAGTREAFRKGINAWRAGAKIQEYFNYIDTDRRKLISQGWDSEDWLVFLGAGGKNVCAAYVSASRFNPGKTIIDQTLYWSVVSSEDEAIYLTGLFNSEAINEVIREFQPRGQFGERHIHTLPLGVTPRYNPSEAAHEDVVEKTKSFLREWNSYIQNDGETSQWIDPNKAKLHIRRSKLREKMASLSTYAGYEAACRSLYGLSN